MTIANNGSTSNAVGVLDDGWAIWIYAPATLTGTITLEVEASSTGTSFVTQQSGGSDVTIPAGKATPLSPIGFRQMRVTSNAAEGAERVFRLTKQIQVGG